MLKKFLSIILIFIIIMFTICSSSYGAIQPVNKESLEQGFQDLMNTKEIDYSIAITSIQVEDDIIIINTEEYGDEMKVKYNLDGEPTFITEMDIEQGMTYDEYSEESDKAGAYTLPYMVIANLNGMSYEYSLMHFALSSLSTIMNEMQDKLQVVEPEEFEANVMEYVNSWYGEPITVSDAEDGNTFEITMEQQDVTDTSCKIVTTLKIKADADFARVQEMMEEQFSNQEQDPPEEVVEEPQEEHEETPVITNNNSSSNNNNNNNNNNIQKTTTTNNLPKAGENTKLYFLIGLIVILVIFFGINYIRLKDVK